MNKTSKIIAGVVIAAILVIGVGYAAITNITLKIGGTATADPAQANFTVKFSGEPQISEEDKDFVTAAVTDEINATLNVSGLTANGDSVSATYTVQNTSADLTAKLSATTSNTNTEYFRVSQEIDSTTLASGEPTTITVTVELIKTPIDTGVSSTVGVQITAEPVQPE